MDKKGEKAKEYSKRVSNNNLMIKDFVECAFMVGWDCALKDQWISVKEKYPKFDNVDLIFKKKMYLLRVVIGNIKQTIEYKIGFLIEKDKFNIEMNLVNVSHWLPIESLCEPLEKDLIKIK